MELTELCQEINNWFDLKRHFGTFTIEGGELQDDIGLLQDQYFRIVGSVFNDGVHKYPAGDLKNETFDGAIWAMAIPPRVIALLGQMTEWEEKYGDVVNSPYTSESFGGYSYTKGSVSGTSGNGSSGDGVFAVFADELNRWRKV